MSIEVATRLKHIRKQHGLSQRELAKRAGVTNGTISLIEQNRVSPSVGSLKKLLECIPMSLAEFFTFELEPDERIVSRRGEMPNLGNEAIAFFLAGSGIRDRNMGIMREVYQPLADTGPDMLTHVGHEGGFVVRGRIELTVEGKTWLLEPGDSYYFESRFPHRFRNPSADEICEVVSANSPPTF
ncbi:cupin domain-containing protein [Trinickia caryophylli]|uniref:Transcriptional regulator, XRE family with cupin sensor n=1 Tax=Trinickia caryophylli TaxID=28094 RepID=A0A1X7E3R1_TRICW|nr:cupin domain-containing protein [Trinickia caryophylli]PMS14283.1 cupin domain-containing protein [Trinickia caryophylli]TRX17692.1 cupin domain-containing protein [Trinickia caryophylli]WQE11546.1 cupin domain-containing protein [Trinickia caryophylli]SMF26413.1 transcriptional regulator, XRE family with cupin sensor [Trinickia caryophylli]GLU32715.1 MerR family transcriptional regulator [Trinickia caryophylli]